MSINDTYHSCSDYFNMYELNTLGTNFTYNNITYTGINPVCVVDMVLILSTIHLSNIIYRIITNTAIVYYLYFSLKSYNELFKSVIKFIIFNILIGLIRIMFLDNFYDNILNIHNECHCEKVYAINSYYTNL